MWFTRYLPTLCLATTSLAAGSVDDEGQVKSIGLRTHTLNQPYLDSDMQSRWYDFGGDAIIRTDQYIRLTSDRPSQTGYLWSRVPLTATNWEVEVEFKIHGKHQLYGDGFAMWVTKQRTEQGPVFGSVDKFDGLGIFFDTYKNNRPGVVFPYVMAMIGDGQKSYDKDTDGKSTEFAGCSARGIRHASVPTKLRLTYFQDKSLKLELHYKSEGEWTVCFETKEPPAIPQVAYLGFTAETGELSDNHDIISISAKNLYTEQGKKGKNTPGSGAKKAASKKGKAKEKLKTAEEAGGSWSWLFIKIFLFVLVIGGAYAGFTAWRTNKRSHRF